MFASYEIILILLVGVEIESKKFPIHYIVELLNKQGCIIVLTGIMHVTCLCILHVDVVTCVAYM